MIKILRIEKVEVKDELDLVQARHRVRAHTLELGLNLVDQTKLVTATSELARNMVDYAKGGTIWIEQIEQSEQGGKPGIRLTFEDHGLGIADLDLAMTDGYSTGGGMGLGLPGAKRLIRDFEIHSQAGVGTHIVLVKWHGSAGAPAESHPPRREGAAALAFTVPG